MTGVSRALAGRYSGCEEQGKDAYREIVLAREILVDETGSHEVNHTQANKIKLIVFILRRPRPLTILG